MTSTSWVTDLPNRAILYFINVIFGPSTGIVSRRVSKLQHCSHNCHHAVVLKAALFLDKIHLVRVLLPIPSYGTFLSKCGSRNWFIFNQPKCSPNSTTLMINSFTFPSHMGGSCPTAFSIPNVNCFWRAPLQGRTT